VASRQALAVMMGDTMAVKALVVRVPVVVGGSVVEDVALDVADGEMTHKDSLALARDRTRIEPTKRCIKYDTPRHALRDGLRRFLAFSGVAAYTGLDGRTDGSEKDIR
jgi:hypothetical protein